MTQFPENLFSLTAERMVKKGLRGRGQGLRGRDQIALLAALAQELNNPSPIPSEVSPEDLQSIIDEIEGVSRGVPDDPNQLPLDYAGGRARRAVEEMNQRSMGPEIPQAARRARWASSDADEFGKAKAGAYSRRMKNAGPLKKLMAAYRLGIKQGKLKGTATGPAARAAAATFAGKSPLLKAAKWIGSKPAWSRGTMGAAATTLPFMIPAMATGASRALRDEFDVGSSFFDGQSGTDEFLEADRLTRAMVRRREQKQKRLEMLRQENTARIMQYAPEMAAKLMAGRELPDQATVIGGRKRTDLLEQVADQMSQGAFAGGAPGLGGE